MLHRVRVSTVQKSSSGVFGKQYMIINAVVHRLSWHRNWRRVFRGWNLNLALSDASFISSLLFQSAFLYISHCAFMCCICCVTLAWRWTLTRIPINEFSNVYLSAFVRGKVFCTWYRSWLDSHASDAGVLRFGFGWRSMAVSVKAPDCGVAVVPGNHQSKGWLLAIRKNEPSLSQTTNRPRTFERPRAASHGRIARRRTPVVPECLLNVLNTLL